MSGGRALGTEPHCSDMVTPSSGSDASGRRQPGTTAEGLCRFAHASHSIGSEELGTLSSGFSREPNYQPCFNPTRWWPVLLHRGQSSEHSPTISQWLRDTEEVSTPGTRPCVCFLNICLSSRQLHSSSNVLLLIYYGLRN